MKTLHPTLIDSLGPLQIEAQAYSEIHAEEIPTLLPAAEDLEALVWVCKFDFARPSEAKGLAALAALV